MNRPKIIPPVEGTFESVLKNIAAGGGVKPKPRRGGQNQTPAQTPRRVNYYITPEIKIPLRANLGTVQNAVFKFYFRQNATESSRRQWHIFL
jgi:hypothetical protein